MEVVPTRKKKFGRKYTKDIELESISDEMRGLKTLVIGEILIPMKISFILVNLPLNFKGK